MLVYRPSWIVSVAASFAFAAAASGDASFQGLGLHPTRGGCNATYAVSGNGRVVVGQCDVTEDTLLFGWLWTEAFGLVVPGPIPGTGEESGFRDASHDGLTIASWAETLAHRIPEAFRWVAGQGWLPLHPDLPTFVPKTCPECPWGSLSDAVSPDGSIIAGQVFNVSLAYWDAAAFRWSGGSAETFIHVGAFTLSRVGGVTDDGAMAVAVTGLGSRGILYYVDPAGRVTNTGVRISERRPRISNDGSTIVSGTDPLASDDAIPTAFRWTPSEGVVELGPVLEARPTFSSIARDVSADARVIVGDAVIETCITGDMGCLGRTHAFVWTEARGMRNLAVELERQGVDLGDWELTSAWGVSADGAVIVGRGVNPDGEAEAWRVQLPEPSMSLLGTVALTVLCTLRPPTAPRQGSRSDVRGVAAERARHRAQAPLLAGQPPGGSARHAGGIRAPAARSG